MASRVRSRHRQLDLIISTTEDVGKSARAYRTMRWLVSNSPIYINELGINSLQWRKSQAEIVLSLHKAGPIYRPQTTDDVGRIPALYRLKQSVPGRFRDSTNQACCILDTERG